MSKVTTGCHHSELLKRVASRLTTSAYRELFESIGLVSDYGTNLSDTSNGFENRTYELGRS